MTELDRKAAYGPEVDQATDPHKAWLPGSLGALRELTADLPGDTPIVVVTRKAHDPDHFYAEVAVEGEQVDLTYGMAVVLTAPEPEDFDA